MKKLALLNTSILTAAGNYIVTDNAVNLDSAIGHASTAEIMTTLLEADIPVNRQMFTQDVGQRALVFKLSGRPEEGKILTTEEIEAIGYKFQLLERLA
uniref:STIV orfB116 family protein n=1 Tax=Enterocloster aldenensis TaxID=358742 RepID=UPI0033900486